MLLPTCDKDGDGMICPGLMLALLDSFQNAVDDFDFESTSQPAFEEAHVHQGAGPQPCSTPHRGVGYPPSLKTRHEHSGGAKASTRQNILMPAAE